MAPNRRFSEDCLKNLVEEYFKEFRTKIKYTSLANYGNEKYDFVPKLNYQDFSRNPAVKQYIDDFNKKIDGLIMDKDGNIVTIQVQKLDVCDFYNKKYDQIEKKVFTVNKDLQQVEKINQELILDLEKNVAKNKELKKKEEQYRIDIARLKIENGEQKKTIEELNSKLKDEKDKNKRLKSFIERHYNDPIFQAHLVEIGFLKEEECVKKEQDEYEEDVYSVINSFYQDGEESIISKLKGIKVRASEKRRNFSK